MTLPAGPCIVDNLLFNDERRVLPWMAERIEGMAGLSFGPATAIGVVRVQPGGGGIELVGGVAYSFWFPHDDGGDCQISMVMVPGARVTRRMYRHLYGHAFTTMNCRRMSLQILKKNKIARRHVEAVGFRVEGVKREGQGRQDIIQYGLLRSEMRNGLPPIKGKH